jgi:hypothetical protein
MIVQPNEHGDHGLELPVNEYVDAADWLARSAPSHTVEWLGKRWQDCVEREMSKSHRPDLVHGLVCTRSHDGSEYLTKLGLEIGSSGTKEGRSGSRTPWDIARDAVAGDVESEALWKEYSAATFRHHQLTFSRGLREKFAVEEVSDEIAAAREEEGPGVLVAELDGDTWRAVTRMRGGVLALLEAAESPHRDTEIPAVIERALRRLDE